MDFHNFNETRGYFYVTLQDIDGNPLADKKVQIGFNGRIYNRTTNSTGRVELQINLRSAGTYTFATAFLGDDNYTGSFVVNKITVIAKQSRIIVTGNNAGKVNQYRTVQVKVNGKTYNVRIGADRKGTLRVRFTKTWNIHNSDKLPGRRCLQKMQSDIKNNNKKINK